MVLEIAAGVPASFPRRHRHVRCCFVFACYAMLCYLGGAFLGRRHLPKDKIAENAQLESLKKKGAPGC